MSMRKRASFVTPGVALFREVTWQDRMLPVFMGCKSILPPVAAGPTSALNVSHLRANKKNYCRDVEDVWSAPTNQRHPATMRD
jgi:hypothetical protein